MLRAARVVEGTISGLHRSPFHGFNVEFAEYREYSPGDDLRQLDWRVLGRTDRYYIKQYEEESNLRATIVMDASASMRYGSGPMHEVRLRRDAGRLAGDAARRAARPGRLGALRHAGAQRFAAGRHASAVGAQSLASWKTPSPTAKPSWAACCKRSAAS